MYVCVYTVVFTVFRLDSLDNPYFQIDQPDKKNIKKFRQAKEPENGPYRDYQDANSFTHG